MSDYAGSGGTATRLLTGGATEETDYPGTGISYQWYAPGPEGTTIITGANLSVTDPIDDFYYNVAGPRTTIWSMLA